MDQILIQGLRLYAYHGVNPEEKRDGQPFELDIAAFADLSRAGETDDLADTVSYAKIAKTAAAAFTSASFDLLERAAAVTAEAILSAFPAVKAVEITLKKPNAPVKAQFDWMGVRIRRERHG